MAEQYYNKQNILNLPKVETINPSDYLLVQDANDDTVTSLIQFENFIIGLDNVTFGPLITELSDSVTDMVIKVDALSSDVEMAVSSISESGGKWENRMGEIEGNISSIYDIIGNNDIYTFSSDTGKTIADSMSALDGRIGEIEFLTDETNIAGVISQLTNFCNAILSARAQTAKSGKAGNMGTYLYNYLSGFSAIEYTPLTSTPESTPESPSEK